MGFFLQARPLLCRALDREEFEGLVDPRLEGNYVESEMLRMIEAAAACVRHLAAKRPRMGQVNFIIITTITITIVFSSLSRTQKTYVLIIGRL